MREPQAKKQINIKILEILRKYTDAEHRLSQKEIVDILVKEYGLRVDRKAVKRNILSLIECGYDIEYNEEKRVIKNAKTGKREESSIWTDFYLEREFSDGELRLLIDGLLFSKYVPYGQCKDLVKKLEGLSNNYFKSRVSHISRMPDEYGDNKQLFLNIEMLDEAISKKKKVSFQYVEYGTDKKIHPRKRTDGTVREYIMSPYQMAAKEGKYYLICNNDKFDSLSNYRIDRIRDIKLLDEQVKPIENLRFASGKTLDLATYMKEHVYMYSSENAHVTFRVNKTMLSDVVDMFGKSIRFSDETETSVNVTVSANEMSIEHFALNYAGDVTVLSPQSLRDKVKDTLAKALEKYSESNL